MKCLSKLILLLLAITIGMAAKRVNGVNFSYEKMEKVFNAAVMHLRCYLYTHHTMSRFNQIFYEIRSIMQSDQALRDYAKADNIIDSIAKVLGCQIKYDDSQDLARVCIKPPTRRHAASGGPARFYEQRHRSPRAIASLFSSGSDSDMFQGIGNNMLHNNIKKRSWAPKENNFPILRLTNGLKVKLIPASYARQIHNENVQLQKKKQHDIARLHAIQVSNCKRIPEVVEACLITREQKYMCQKGTQRISLTQLCDGDFDCNDRSDERSCHNQVAVLLKNTKSLVYRLGSSLSESDCIQYLLDQYTELSLQKTFLDQLDDDVESTAHDIVINVNNVYEKIKTSFCFRETLHEINMYTKHERFKSVSPDSAVIKTTCSCRSGHCLSPCLPVCKVTCARIQALGQFNCTNGKATSVPIPRVCDGFADCDDRADEANCTSTNETQNKLTAQNTLQTMLKNLHKMINSQSNEYILPQLLTFQKNIVELQRNFTKIFHIASFHMKNFESLSNIFPKKMDTGKFSWDLVDMLYDRLMSFKEDLLLVYKLVTHDVGKAKQGVECPCVDDHCLNAECSVACASVCQLQGSLMYYGCRNSLKRIRLGAVCDGAANCIQGDDEENCNTGICKTSHFYGLLSNISIGNEFDDNIGKALASWKQNVNDNIDLTLGSVTKPDHTALVNLVEEAIQTLSVLYGKHGKNTTTPLKKLVIISARKLIQNIKNCQL